MKALKYKLVVVDGVMDYIHGMSETIDEYYFPDPVNLCMNYKAVFPTTEEDATERRKKAENVEEISIASTAIVSRLLMLSTSLIAAKKAEKEIRSFFKLSEDDEK